MHAALVAAASPDRRQAGRFPEALLGEIRQRLPLPALIGRHVKLARAGRDWTGCCPFHEERTPSFAVYRDHYHCFGCGAHGDVFGYLMAAERLDFPAAVAAAAQDAGVALDRAAPARTTPQPPVARAAAPEDVAEAAGRRRAAQRVWLEAEPVLRGTLAADYLAGRGIDLAVLGRQPRALRFHPRLKHMSGGVFPALVAAITRPVDGEFLGTHRTWLSVRDGRVGKAPIEPAKMSLGFVGGGAISLWRGASGKSIRSAPEGETVVIGEGIETCLSIALACPELRVIAAVALGNLGRVALPPQIRTVILAADNDAKPAAQRQLQRAVELHLEAGRTVRVARSPLGKDFNDVLGAFR